jgi:hypothetical protein
MSSDIGISNVGQIFAPALVSTQPIPERAPAEVRQECLDLAMADDELVSMWGGTTGAQRREMRANRERRRSGSVRTQSAGQPYGVNDCQRPSTVDRSMTVTFCRSMRSGWEAKCDEPTSQVNHSGTSAASTALL